MIYGIFHEGSGLGNQLHRYVMTRVLAKDKGYKFGMMNKVNFKGRSFMNLDMGSPIIYNQPKNVFNEKKIVENGIDVRGYDPEIKFVLNETIIDGEFQDERYFEHRLPEIRKWLKVQPVDLPDNLCIINFRGGEYKYFPDLFLTKEYWDLAIEEMKKLNHDIKFEVHTDDPDEAQKFFPNYKIINDMGLNWRSIRYAKYLVLSNSSFAILPALCNENVKKIFAPRYWARRNIKIWALPQNYYKKFTYL